MCLPVFRRWFITETLTGKLDHCWKHALIFFSPIHTQKKLMKYNLFVTVSVLQLSICQLAVTLFSQCQLTHWQLIICQFTDINKNTISSQNCQSNCHFTNNHSTPAFLKFVSIVSSEKKVYNFSFNKLSAPVTSQALFVRLYL